MILCLIALIFLPSLSFLLGGLGANFKTGKKVYLSLFAFKYLLIFSTLYIDSINAQVLGVFKSMGVDSYLSMSDFQDSSSIVFLIFVCDLSLAFRAMRYRSLYFISTVSGFTLLLFQTSNLLNFLGLELILILLVLLAFLLSGQKKPRYFSIFPLTFIAFCIYYSFTVLVGKLVSLNVGMVDIPRLILDLGLYGSKENIILLLIMLTLLFLKSFYFIYMSLSFSDINDRLNRAGICILGLICMVKFLSFMIPYVQLSTYSSHLNLLFSILIHVAVLIFVSYVTLGKNLERTVVYLSLAGANHLLFTLLGLEETSTVAFNKLFNFSIFLFFAVFVEEVLKKYFSSSKFYNSTFLSLNYLVLFVLIISPLNPYFDWTMEVFKMGFNKSNILGILIVLAMSMYCVRLLLISRKLSSTSRGAV